MEIKDKIEILSKQIEVIHKKLLILLPTIAGTWIYGLTFIKDENIFLNILAIILFIIFIFLSFGVGLNYLKLSRIEKEVQRIKDVE